MKKVIAIIITVLFIIPFGFGQTGSLEGKIIDTKTKEELIGVNITLYEVDSSQEILGTNTDYNGNYRLDSIPVGIYDIEISYAGYASQWRKKIKIKAGDIAGLNIKLISEIESGPVMEKWRAPMFSPDNFTRGRIYSAKEIRKFR